jgi:hypothetical protein
MEICSDAANSQTAKLEEFVLVAHRIRKAGRGARPRPSKFKLSPRKGGHTRVSFLTSGKNSLTANGSFVSASPELEEAPSSTISLLILRIRFTEREGSRARVRRFRSLSRIARDPSKQARKHKLTRSGVMADRKESFSNGHSHLLLPWVLRRSLLRRAGSKAQADCAPLRPTRSRPRIGKDYNKQVGKRKLPCSRAMADPEECFSNSRLR